MKLYVKTANKVHVFNIVNNRMIKNMLKLVNEPIISYVTGNDNENVKN